MPRQSAPLAGLFLALAVAVSPADETSDRQKTVALDNLKKAEIAKTSVVETANLIVCSPLPEPRAKAVAAMLEKAYGVARKGLQYDPKEQPWPGKLTVYHLPDRKEYGLFLRLVAGQRPDVPSHVAVRGDEPFVVSGADLPSKAPDADVAAELAPLVGGALLQAKAGAAAPVPAWVRDGYGRAAALRAEGTGGKRFTAYRSQARLAVLGGKGKGPAPIGDVWDGGDDMLATSLVDYMAFGADKANAEKFPRFVSALRADENGDAPSMMMVLESAGWKAPELEAAWRKWVQGGMAAK